MILSLSLILLMSVAHLVLLPGTENSNLVNYEDKTKYLDGREKCGNVDSGRYYNCYCASDKIVIKDKYCCVNVNETQCYVSNINSFGKCQSGELKNINELCYRKCYNSYQHSQYVGDKAHFTCPDTCVPLLSMCSGIDFCLQELYECQEENLRCQDSCVQSSVFPDCAPAKYRVETLQTKLVDGHAYCYSPDSSYNNDGRYDTIGRSDESGLTSDDSEVVDYKTLEKCQFNDYFTTDGIQCGDECIPSYQWCTNKDATKECTISPNVSISVNNPILCQDVQFLSKVSCVLYNDPIMFDGYVSYNGSRCTGQIQHCVSGWYGRFTKTTNDRYSPPVCEDKSDQVIKSGKTCSSISSEYLNQWQETFCQYLSYTYGKEYPECKDGEAWLSEQTDSHITDPHNCQGSCSDEERSKGLDCQSCTNPDYFQCLVDVTCLHPDLRCDGHPQCSDLSDEEDCYEEYLRRGIIRDSSTFECKSKNYPGKDFCYH